jgi:chemotaxis protein MotB
MNAPPKQKEMQALAEQQTEAPSLAATQALRPIIKKVIVEDGHGGHHGGAWKIALADMMTAMMAFFLLMWLLGATQEEKRKSVAEYLKPTSQSIVTMGKLAGSNGLLGGTSIIDVDGFKFKKQQTGLLNQVTPRSEAGPDVKDGSSDSPRNREGQGEETKAMSEQQQKAKESLDKIEKELMQSLQGSSDIRAIAGTNVSISRDAEGLKIDLLDGDKVSMFQLGTAKPNENAVALISRIAKIVAKDENLISVRGHTDSAPYIDEETKNNWILSTERADATRRLLEQQGIGPKRFLRIEGVADTQPFVPENPRDARNRRVSIFVRPG